MSAVLDVTGSAIFAAYLPAFPDGADVTRHHYDSLEAFARAIPDTAPPGLWNEGAWEPKADWTGSKNMAAARALALGGWTEGAAAVERIAARVALLSPVAPRIALWDVAGAVASVPRHLAGNPLAMRRSTPSKKRPVLTLLADLGNGGNVDADVLTAGAGVVAAVVDRLEAVGFRVEVLCGIRSSKNYDRSANAGANRAEIVWRVKAPEEAADPSRLAFGMGHPSALRRLAFAAWCLTPECKAAVGETYGRPVAYGQLPDRPDATFILPPASALPRDEMKAFEFILTTLRKQDCPGIPAPEETA